MTFRYISTFVLALLFSVQASAQDFTFDLSVSDGTDTESVTLGVNPSGTNAYDEGLDVYAPPPPPSGLYVTTTSTGGPYSTDIHGNSGSTAFPISVTGAAGGSTITVSWDDSDLASRGTFLLEDPFNGAIFADVDMTSQGSVSFSSAVSSFTVTVTPLVAPVANDDSAQSDGSPVDIDVLDNDTTEEGTLDASTVTIVEDASNGSTEVNSSTGEVTYTPDAEFSGSDTFTYTVENSEGVVSNQATVTVAVSAPPVANDDDATVDEDSFVDIDVLDNDTDSDGTIDATTVVIESDPSDGTVEVNPTTGVVTYTPDDDFNGSDEFTYTVQDNDGSTSNEATVSVTVEPTADDPVAEDDEASVDEDDSVDVDVLDNDSDVDGDDVSILEVGDPSNGQASANQDGSITYTPDENFNGEDSFEYTISDGNEGTATATVYITIDPVNDAPAPVDDEAETDEDTVVSIPVLDNDVDIDSEILTIGTLVQPANGSIVKNGEGGIDYTPDQDFNGTDTFTYQARDDSGGRTTATVTVTVNPVNDNPVAETDQASTTQGVAVTISPLDNDTDVDGDDLELVSVGDASFGETQQNENGTVTYTPGDSFNGSDSFTYGISDGNGGSATGTIIISVNAFPVAVTDEIETAEDEAITFDPLDNDTDAEDDPIEITDFSQALNGTVSLSVSGDITYTPDENFNGSDSFEYQIRDSEGGTDTGVVEITVTPVNDDPVAEADTAEIDEDGEAEIDVLDNDSDVDGDEVTVSSVDTPSFGVASIDGETSRITYTPDENAFGTDEFDYTISDGNGGSATGQITVVVNEINDEPTAEDDDVETSLNRAIIIDVLANDADVDGDDLSVDEYTSPEHGELTENPDGTLTYTPDDEYVGEDGFSYVVSDGRGGSDEAEVDIIVNENAAPEAVSDAGTVKEDGFVLLDVLANDFDLDEDEIMLIGAESPSGKAVVTVTDDQKIRYAPILNFNGADTFLYTIQDDRGAESVGTVNMTVAAINDPPSVRADEASTGEGQPVEIDVVANDSDPDGSIPTVRSLGQPSNGTAVETQYNTIIYTPNAGFVGTDSFTYTAGDAFLSGSATVTVTVIDVNDAPVAVADAVVVDEDASVSFNPASNDTDADGDALSIVSITAASNGVASLGDDGEVTYSPAANFNGSDAFTYIVADPDGLQAEGEVSITVNPVNDAPIATDDSKNTTSGTKALIRVLENDEDADGDSLTPSVSTAPSHGTASVDVANGLVEYTSNAAYVGTDTFSYQVDDGNGGTAVASIVVTVTAVAVDNDGIDVAVEDGVDGDGDGTPDGDGNGDGVPDSEQANVASLTSGATGTYVTLSAPEGTALATVEVTETPETEDEVPEEAEFPIGFISYGLEGLEAGGSTTVTINLQDEVAANSYWKYGPTPDNTTPHWYNFAYDGETGAEIFPALRKIVLHFVDGERGDDDLRRNGYIDDPGAPALIQNAAPQAVKDVVSVQEDSSLEFNVLTNDVDNDGDVITVISVSTPAHGSVVLGTDGTIEYTPEADYFGADEFTYVVQDEFEAQATGRVVVTVEGTNDVPVLMDDDLSANEDEVNILDVGRNDFDADGDVLTYAIVDSTAHGTVIVDGSTVVYTPDADYIGSDAFTYSVDDGNGGQAEASVVISVLNTNDNPVATNDSVVTPINTAVIVDVLSNDVDPDGNTMVIVDVSGARKGTVEISSDSLSVVYTPSLNQSGWDTFQYSISDGLGGIGSSTVAVHIQSSNVAPVALADEFTVDVGKATLLDILANDTDENGDSLRVVSVVDPEFGSVVLQDDGQVSYTPDEGFEGTDSFSYTISDAFGEESIGQVTVSVSVINDAPQFLSELVFDQDALSFGAEEDVSIPFESAEDEEGGALVYTWSVYSDSLGTEVLLTGESDQSNVQVSAAELTALLDQFNIAFQSSLDAWIGVSVADEGGLTATSMLQKVEIIRQVSGVGVESLGEVPTTFALHDSYPNPFNPTTSIEYDVAAATFVRITVYDLTGRVVGELVSADHAPGRYRVRFDAGSLSSGVYVYAIQAGSFSTAKTFVLMK